MRRLLPHPLLTPALALVWLLLVNSAAPARSYWVLLAGRFPGSLCASAGNVRIDRPLALLRFIGVVLATFWWRT